MLTADWLECQGCSVLDRNRDRMRTGFVCSECGYESTAGLIYFHVNIHILIDLIQESYHSQKNETGCERLYEGEGPHDISVVIFFCTLREALLENLISRLLAHNQIPERVQERLLSDNKFYVQKQDKLFMALTGEKWGNAIKALNEAGELDYDAIDQFVREAADARNEFIHSGRKWHINRALSKSCVEHIWGLINLYASLHNRYIHQKKPLTRK